ncbi:ATP-binding protein [Nonomuraea sp. NBC_00507]|uniref:ATP-binding protein n=1 Tax=Nonomuraea sp. NBC_00507 TaxID=2976002 RepID=UPI002E19BFFC
MLSGTTKKSGLLGPQLQTAREAAFVGRKEELTAFGSALYGGGSSVLFVHGPGGIGKSALMRRLAGEAAVAGRSVITVDGRTIEASPEAFEAEAGPVLRDRRAVLMVDTFERIQGLEGWLRERFLPRLPLGALVVVAGRIPPDAAWRADPAWAGAVTVLPLRELASEEARALVDTRGVAVDLQEPLLAFAGGHPLALSLAAAVAVKDRQASQRWRPNQDVVATLLDQLVGEVPSLAHRQVLEACAHAYTTTEDLLRAVVPGDVGPLFSWLRQLPFIEPCRLGLYPHDVAREVLETDLRWRDPQGHAAMHQRIRAFLTDSVRTVPDTDVLPAVGSLFFLSRDNPMTSGPYHWRGHGEVHEDVFRPEDLDTLVRLAGVAESEESAAVAAFWAARRPEAFRLYRRTETGEPVAFDAWLRLEEPREHELAADPIAAAAWAHVRTTAPLRAGEHLAISRYWALPGYRDNSPVMDLIQWRMIAHCLRDGRMAWSCLAVRGPDESRSSYLRHYDMHDIAERPRLGADTYGMFVHDWRAVPAHAWLERLDRLPAAGPQEHADMQRAGLAVLSQEEFAQAVRAALRHLFQPGALAASPLAQHSRLITGHSSSDPAEALRDLLEQAIESLRDEPRASKPHRALDMTFLRDAPTQEVAAERLDLPFTTYRRHLTAGIERICADLWHRELHGSRTTAHGQEPARK